ncbi:MAG: hypothetical protein ABIQ99_11745 [Thermoflexales bacterium]
MLKVVEHQQRGPVAQGVNHLLGRRAGIHGGQAQRPRDRVGHPGGIFDRAKLDKTAPVRKAGGEPCRDLDGQARFADPGRPGQGQQALAVAGQDVLGRRQVGLAPDQAGGRRAEVQVAPLARWRCNGCRGRASSPGGQRKALTLGGIYFERRGQQIDELL